MYPTRALYPIGSARMSDPRTRTRPASGLRSPTKILIVVVFPAPFGPMSPMISPSWASRNSPWSATVPSYAFQSSWISTAAVIGDSACVLFRPTSRWPSSSSAERVAAGLVPLEALEPAEGVHPARAEPSHVPGPRAEMRGAHPARSRTRPDIGPRGVADRAGRSRCLDRRGPPDAVEGPEGKYPPRAHPDA